MLLIQVKQKEINKIQKEKNIKKAESENYCFKIAAKKLLTDEKFFEIIDFSKNIFEEKIKKAKETFKQLEELK